LLSIISAIEMVNKIDEIIDNNDNDNVNTEILKEVEDKVLSSDFFNELDDIDDSED
jgi:cell division FtsZ-interacting protein ZapD